MNQKNEDVPYGYYSHQNDRINLSAEIQHQPHRTRGLKSNGTETYAKAPYFQMASDSLSIL